MNYNVRTAAVKNQSTYEAPGFAVYSGRDVTHQRLQHTYTLTFISITITTNQGTGLGRLKSSLH
jgi:hypothetical protein